MHFIRRHWMLASAFIALSVHADSLSRGEYYGSGYTIISQAQGNDDLQATVYRQLTPGTVGQALPQLLDGSGWRLADSYAADDRIYRLYNQPLPEHKQRIGPMPLDQALTWIAGEGWALVVDPVNRLVSFEVEARYDNRPPAVAARPRTAVSDTAPVATQVYADLTPQGTFPVVQPAASYATSAPAERATPPANPWQAALPPDVVATRPADTPRNTRSNRKSPRKALRPAVATAGDKVAAVTAMPSRAEQAAAKKNGSGKQRADAALAEKATVTKAAATSDKATSGAQTAAAKGTSHESKPTAAAQTVATSTTDKTDKKAAVPAAGKKTAPAAVNTDNEKSAAAASTKVEKTAAQTDKSTLATEKAAAPAENSKTLDTNKKNTPATTAKPAADSTEKAVAAAQATVAEKTAPIPAKNEAPTPVLANPAQPAAKTDSAAKDTPPQTASAGKRAADIPTQTLTMVGPPPPLLAKRSSHVPPQEVARPSADNQEVSKKAAAATPSATAPTSPETSKEAP